MTIIVTVILTPLAVILTLLTVILTKVRICVLVFLRQILNLIQG